MESNSSLREMQERMNQWMAEKPSTDFGANLRVQEGDIILFQFVASGNDGDQFLKPFKAHAFAGPPTRTGLPTTIHKYCLRANEGGDCQYCNGGDTKLKERMSMWLYVQNILHTVMPADKQFPQVNYEGRYYFNEEVNGFKIWHTSAWKDSPWADICKLAEVYKGLHNFTAQMVVIGASLTRRFKIYAMPQSPTLPDEIYVRAKAECEPIPSILKKELATPVAANPQAVPQQAQPMPNGQFVPPLGGHAVGPAGNSWGASNPTVVPFVPAGAPTNVPTFTLGQPLGTLDAHAIANTSPPVPAPQVEPPESMPPNTPQVEAPESQPPFEVEEGDKLLDEPTENPRRPLQKLF